MVINLRKTLFLLFIGNIAGLYIHASSGAWSSSAVDLNWDNDANWSGSSFPNGAGQAAAFIGVPGTEVVDSSQDVTIGGLSFDNPGYSVTVGFDSYGLIFDNNSTIATIGSPGGQTHFIDTPIMLNSDLSINVSNSGSIYFRQPISGDHSVEILVDSSTHINFEAAHNYTGDTIIKSGYLDANGPGSTQNIPGNVIIDGSGALKHGTGTLNNYAATSSITMNGGTLDLYGSTQTIASVLMSKHAVLQGSQLGSELCISAASSDTALAIADNSVVIIDKITLVNGGSISSAPELSVDGSFLGMAAPSGHTVIDLNGHGQVYGNEAVQISTDIGTAQNPALRFYEVQFTNGALKKTGYGAISFHGSQCGIVDLDIEAGVVQLGGIGDPATVRGSAAINIYNGGYLQGFGTLGASGDVSVTNITGSLAPGGPFMPGSITISGNYEQQAQAQLFIQGSAANTINTLFVQNGEVKLDGSLCFIAMPHANFNPGDECVIIDNAGGFISGIFSNFYAELPDGLSAWLEYRGNQVVMVIASCDEASCLLPPQNIHINSLVKYCSGSQDFINKLTWSPSPSANIVGYNIYINDELVATYNTQDSYIFEHHFNPSLPINYVYKVTAFLETQEESAPTFVSVIV